MPRSVVLLALVASDVVSSGQAPPTTPLPDVRATPQTAAAKSSLQYAGKPLRVEFKCTNEDILAAGLNCPIEEPCPLYLELSAVESVGNRIVAVGNLHTQSATVASVLLVSEDGHTWTEPFEHIRLGALDQIQFFDFESGWVSGQVVVSTIPRDPFFVLTTDGGKTWRRRPLWDESRPGLIESFWFDSKRHGLLAVDRIQSGDDESRYALYESQTGGEGWSIRQASPRRLNVERRSGNTDLRVRADGPSKAYRIERRQAADRWQTVAAFLIDAGACKADEAPTVEPPPPPPPEEAPKPETAPRKPPPLKKKSDRN